MVKKLKGGGEMTMRNFIQNRVLAGTTFLQERDVFLPSLLQSQYSMLITSYYTSSLSKLHAPHGNMNRVCSEMVPNYML